MCPFWYDEIPIVNAETPVHDTNEDFKGCRAHREVILNAENSCRGCDVGKDAGGEGQEGESKADDGEVLEMPTVGVVDGRGVIEEPLVGVDEGGKAEELGSMLVLWEDWWSERGTYVEYRREAVEGWGVEPLRGMFRRWGHEQYCRKMSRYGHVRKADSVRCPESL